MLKQLELFRRRWQIKAVSALEGLSDRVYLALHSGPLEKSVPDFAIIGAMKTGTTSLHNYLDKHPDIYMSYIKEPGLFLDNPPALDRYPQLRTREDLVKVSFRGYKGQRLIGESSTYYTEAPTLGSEAPMNMDKQAPGIKLIYMLRNPLDRIISHYWHCVDFEIYTEPIDAVLAKDDTFLERSLYWFQLARYLEYFPAEQVHVVLLEEFKKDAAGELRKIYEFLGVDPDAAGTPETEKTYNRSVSRPQGNSEAARLSRASYEALIGPLKEDVAALEQFLGRSLAGVWDLSAERWTSP